MPETTNVSPIAGEQEVLQCMTEIMRSEKASASEKLRAAEKLASLLGIRGGDRSGGDPEAAGALSALLALEQEGGHDKDEQ